MNIVAIPTLGKSPLLPSMLAGLLRDHVDLILVYDNGAQPRMVNNFGPYKCNLIDARGWPFYRMWNDAITFASHWPEGNLAILNDDLRLTPDTILYLAAALRTSPDIGIVSPNYRRPLSAGVEIRPGLRTVHGVYRNGGISGFAFMVRAETCPLIDEQFEIWYGDDDLVAKIEAQGQRACIVEGLPIEHEESTTLNQTDWVPAAITRDRDRWAALGRT